MEEPKGYTHTQFISLRKSLTTSQELTSQMEIYLSLALITLKITLKLVLSQNLEITLVFIDLSQNGKFVKKPKLKITQHKVRGPCLNLSFVPNIIGEPKPTILVQLLVITKENICISSSYCLLH